MRRNGWKGTGPIPWSHEPNRGFLRALWALSAAAGRIGDAVEQERCADFLRDSSPEATSPGHPRLTARPAPPRALTVPTRKVG